MDVLYLIPSTDSPDAQAALDLPENRRHVSIQSFQQIGGKKSEKRCFSISIPDSGPDVTTTQNEVQPWGFQFGSRACLETDIHLPSLNGNPVKFFFGFAGYTGYGEATREHNLIVRECSDQDEIARISPNLPHDDRGIAISDAMVASDEVRGWEPVVNRSRFIEGMMWLSCQDYIFEVRYPRRLDIYDTTVKRVSWPTTLDDNKQDWREVGRQPLGSGGFGEVFKERDMYTGRLVACKRMAISATKLKRIENAEREIDAMVSLSHSNIITLHNFTRHADNEDEPRIHYFSIRMPLCKGSLDTLLKGGTAKAQFESMMKQIIAGLRHLHNRNIIHRDLKAQNVLYNEPTPNEFTLHLADLGLVKTFEASRCITIAGSPGHMAPEILKAYKGPAYRACKAVDIFSLGVLAMWMLAPDDSQRLYDAYETGLLAMRDYKAYHVALRGLAAVFEPQHFFWSWIVVMLAEKPELRPSLEEIADSLGY